MLDEDERRTDRIASFVGSTDASWPTCCWQLDRLRAVLILAEHGVGENTCVYFTVEKA